MDFFQLVTYGMVGIGLAASCGFRVFVPGLFMSFAVHAGALELSDGWEWIGSWPAMIMFCVASLLEVVGYFIPWFDHLLDGRFSAGVSGSIVSPYSQETDSPFAM